MVSLANARGPRGQRLYAIGDVHGMLGALRAMETLIEADLAADPPEDWHLVLLGDYVDRGPGSPAVLDWVAERLTDGKTTALLGNHDAMFLDAIETPDSPTIEGWLAYGGLQTLAAYQLSPERSTLHASLQAAVPEEQRTLLAGLPLCFRAADYFFVHAGIDPSRPIDAQRPDDLIWIRRPFLDSTAEFDAVVVHGHTPVRSVEMHPNRIALDTGAVFGRTLSCLVIDEAERRILSVPGQP
ncbi:MAG: metallophosphoesterase family protein [Pseudomonadota bacterium]